MKDKIIQLIADKLSNEIDSKNNEVLVNWIRKSSQNKKIYNSYVGLFSDIQKIKNKDIIINSKLHFNQVKEKIIKKQKNKILFKKILYLVAAVLLPAIIFITIFFNTNSARVDFGVPIAQITPSVKKVELVLSTGERFELLDKVLSINKKDININNKENRLIYFVKDKHVIQKVRYNTLIVGRGEEFQLTLTDGTKVWLNSESVLKYPVFFSAKNRKVELKGEAYFEVAHNPQKPFIVNTPEINIEVLGTSFNVSAYADDKVVYATLVKGKVKVHNNFGDLREEILQPNQQLVYSKIKNCVVVNQVDAKFYSAWKDGVFIFDNESLAGIMRKLERWYDIRVFFQNMRVQKIRFSGKILRFRTCSEVLEVIKKTTYIDFKIQGDRTIIIE